MTEREEIIEKLNSCLKAAKKLERECNQLDDISTTISGNYRNDTEIQGLSLEVLEILEKFEK